MAFLMATFMQEVNQVNDHFTESRSNLKKLLVALREAPVKTGKIAEEVALLRSKHNKKYLKYINAIDYLMQNPPGNLPAVAFPTGAVPYKFKCKCTSYVPKPQTQYRGYPVINYPLGGRPIFGPGMAQNILQAHSRHEFHFTCTWSSTSGSLNDLANVRTREKVYFGSDPALAPFNYINEHHHADGPPPNYLFVKPKFGMVNGKDGNNLDVHSTKDPRFLVRYPNTNGILILHQVYQYLTGGNPASDDNWIDIPSGHFQLHKSVVTRGGGHAFKFEKKHVAEGSVKSIWSKHIQIEAINNMHMLPKTYGDIPPAVGI